MLWTLEDALAAVKDRMPVTDYLHQRVTRDLTAADPLLRFLDQVYVAVVNTIDPSSEQPDPRSAQALVALVQAMRESPTRRPPPAAGR